MSTLSSAGNQRQRIYHTLANWCALFGGFVLTGIALMSVYSVVMRNFLGKPIQGDFELVQVACAVSIAAFMPLCHLKSGHIIVDFFTTRASEKTRSRLDALGALLLGLVFLLLAWRTGVGASDALKNSESSMMMGFPLWIGYALMVPSLALAGLIGVMDGLLRFRGGQGLSIAESDPLVKFAEEA